MQKILVYFFVFLFSIAVIKAQNIEVSISNPEPRMEQEFEVIVNINPIKTQVFNSLIGKYEMVDGPDFINSDVDVLRTRIKPMHSGANTLGPLSFEINDTKYNSNILTFNVADALPKVTEGVWFRLVKKDVSAFYVIIDQRMPQETDTEKRVKLHPASNNFKEISSDVQSGGGVMTDGKTGVTTKFKSLVSVYLCEMGDSNAKITITKNDFINLPAGFTFENIELK